MSQVPKVYKFSAKSMKSLDDVLDKMRLLYSRFHRQSSGVSEKLARLRRNELARIFPLFRSDIFLNIARIILGPHLACVSLCSPLLLMLYFWASYYSDPTLFVKPLTAIDSCPTEKNENLTCQNTYHNEERDIFSRLHLNHLPYFIVGLFITMSLVYIGVATLIHNAFYVKKKDAFASWKIQPEKFIDPDLEFKGILKVLEGFFLVALIPGTIACYVLNQGPLSKLYYNLDGCQLWWTVIQGPLLLLWQDHTDYWRHRIFHSSWLFKKFHKVHHKYPHPTSFVTFAWHPLEITLFFLVNMTAFFVVPVYFGWVVVISVFTIGHNLLDHSGVNLKAPRWLPLIPDVVFHDRHHQRGDVNFGFHFWLCDALFGTCEQVRS